MKYEMDRPDLMKTVVPSQAPGNRDRADQSSAVRRRTAVVRTFLMDSEVPEISMGVRYTQQTSRPAPGRRSPRRLRQSA